MRDTIEAVATRALGCDYKIWGFGEGMALLGLLRAGATLDRPEWMDAVADLVAPTLPHNMAARPTDHLIPVEVLAELHRLRPTTGVAASIDRFVRAVWRDEAPVPTHRPDLPELADTVWVDCMHTDGPGLRVAGRPAAAASAIALACARLQDVTGLFSHSYAETTGRADDVHWGRGQGWALHGLVCLDDTGSRSRADRLLEALARVELDGGWRTIVDDPRAPVEHSVSALVASGVYHGLRAATVDPSRRDLADRALRAAVDALDGDGGLPASAATPAGAREAYLGQTTGVHPWGQGPLLLALLDAAAWEEQT